MVQKYLPEITQGDKRVLIIGGEPVPFALARIPQGTEIRGNMAAGGKGTAVLRSDADLEELLQRVDPQNWIVEEFVSFDLELAVVAARDDSARTMRDEWF
jgi:glutathione synthase/RimK-type ligase-like ATP-grasp enzyme